MVKEDKIQQLIDEIQREIKRMRPRFREYVEKVYDYAHICLDDPEISQSTKKKVCQMLKPLSECDLAVVKIAGAKPTRDEKRMDAFVKSDEVAALASA